MIFEGLGALGSDGGARGRFLVKKGDGLRYLPHPFGSNFSMFFRNFLHAIFEEAPGSKKHRKLLQK